MMLQERESPVEPHFREEDQAAEQRPLLNIDTSLFDHLRMFGRKVSFDQVILLHVYIGPK